MLTSNLYNLTENSTTELMLLQTHKKVCGLHGTLNQKPTTSAHVKIVEQHWEHFIPSPAYRLRVDEFSEAKCLILCGLAEKAALLEIIRITYAYVIHLLTANFNSHGPRNNYEIQILDFPQNIQRKSRQMSSPKQKNK